MREEWYYRALQIAELSEAIRFSSQQPQLRAQRTMKM